MEEKKKKKGSALPIVSIILSCVSILLALVILAWIVLAPIVEFLFAIGMVLFVWSIPLTIFIIMFIIDSDQITYSTVPIYGGCQIVSNISFLTPSEVVIPQTINDEQVISIGESVFQGRDDITSVVLPDGLKNIEASAFAFCPNLEKVVIPDSVEDIGDNAFIGCTSLKEIEIGASTRFIGNNAFQDCTSLEKVTFKNGLEDIGMQAFYGCTSIKAIEIPSGVFKIGMGAFFGCDGMTTAMIYGTYNVGEGTVSVTDYPNLQDMANALTGIYSQYDWER